MKYYILSIQHSWPKEVYLTWWRPDDAGYTLYLESAGKYAIETVADKPWYYNNGKETLAIPCDAIDKLSVQAKVGWEKGTVVSRRRLKKLIKEHKKGA